MIQFGAHVDAPDPLAQARALGADIIQVTLGDPQSWKGPKPAFDWDLAEFGHRARAAGVGIYVHSPFVINVASTNNRIRIPSRKLLQSHIDAAAELGARGIVVHGGHVTADDPLEVGFENWFKAIDGLRMELPVLIENTAGGNHAMARRWENLARLWTAVMASDNADHVGFCLDTCHAHASGNPIDTILDDVLAITGRIDLVHLNDSRDAAGSGADRHANLGAGQADPDYLVDIVRRAHAPAILETPAGGHADDLAWIRARVRQTAG